MWDDPVVNEVRTIGNKIVSEYDYDIHKFAVMLKENTEELKNSGWKIVKKEDLIKQVPEISQ